jgi:hypothetical protein
MNNPMTLEELIKQKEKIAKLRADLKRPIDFEQHQRRHTFKKRRLV